MKNLVLVVPSTDDEFLKINKFYTNVLDKFNLKYVISSYNLNILKDINLFSGIILTGGGDFSQEYLAESLHPLASDIYPERDKFEIELVKLAYKKRITTLGICRGAQCINLALGGTINQHIGGHIQAQPKKISSHFAHIKEGSKLHKILEKDKINVNSFHHQVIENVSSKLICCARSTDGYVEAVEAKENFFFVGVQWHPEAMINEESDKLFKEFTKNIVNV